MPTEANQKSIYDTIYNKLSQITEAPDIITFNPTYDELFAILSRSDWDLMLTKAADKVRRRIFGTDVYIRGLIEFTNYCRNNCFYCGIRKGNTKADRYRLTADDILSCCNEGYLLGFRTFVLQGGEDDYFTDDILCGIISRIRSSFPDCAITLSLGERSRKSYLALFDAGADRYLLRHETADNRHYARLHPKSMSPENRKRCLYDLKDIGYQTGSGFMVGSPFQTLDCIAADLRFLKELNPHMIGIGTYITHSDTPFKDFKNGSLELTLKLISIIRLMFPYALIPAATALGTISPDGRERGLKAGANVVMPNLSPTAVRKKYSLYDNKKCTDYESAQCLKHLAQRIESAGYKTVIHRGDSPMRTTAKT